MELPATPDQLVLQHYNSYEAYEEAKSQAQRTWDYLRVAQALEDSGGITDSKVETAIRSIFSADVRLQHHQELMSHNLQTLAVLTNFLLPGSVIEISPRPNQKVPIMRWAGSEYYEHHEVFQVLDSADQHFDAVSINYDSVDHLARAYDQLGKTWAVLTIDPKTLQQNFEVNIKPPVTQRQVVRDIKAALATAPLTIRELAQQLDHHVMSFINSQYRGAYDAHGPVWSMEILVNQLLSRGVLQASESDPRKLELGTLTKKSIDKPA